MGYIQPTDRKPFICICLFLYTLSYGGVEEESFFLSLDKTKLYFIIMGLVLLLTVCVCVRIYSHSHIQSKFMMCPCTLSLIRRTGSKKRLKAAADALQYFLLFACLIPSMIKSQKIAIALLSLQQPVQLKHCSSNSDFISRVTSLLALLFSMNSKKKNFFLNQGSAKHKDKKRRPGVYKRQSDGMMGCTRALKPSEKEPIVSRQLRITRLRDLT